MPKKSEPKTRARVGTTERTTAIWEVARDCCRTLLTMYMMSSTAEVMCGGLELSGLCGLRERSGGCSSSWKAFSTERRKKKVVMVLKGVIIRSVIFLMRVELSRNFGIGEVSLKLSAPSCGLAHLLTRKRVYSDHL